MTSAISEKPTGALGQPIKDAGGATFSSGFRRAMFFVLATAAALYFSLAISSMHFSRAESYFAESVREMIKAGNWITPLYHGKAFMDKPIIQYWLILASFKTFGVSHFTARIPTIIASLLTCAITGFAGAWLYRKERSGLTAAMVLASSFMFLSFSYLCMSDISLTLLDTISLSLLYAGIVKPQLRTKLWMATAVSMGFAFLVKGPVGVVLPGFAGLVFLTATRQLKIIKASHIVAGLAIVALIAVPWFIMVFQANGASAPAHFFITENLMRFTGAHYDNHRPVWFMLQSLALGFLPWSVFLPFALWTDLKTPASNRRSGALYLWIWLFTVTGFFSLSHCKCDYYELPAYPAAAILAGNFIAHMLERRPRAGAIFGYTMAFAFAATAIGAAVLLPGFFLNQSPIAWCLMPAACALAAIGIFVALRQRNTFAALCIAFGGIALAGAGLGAQAFPEISRQQPIKAFVKTLNSAPRSSVLGLDVALASYTDQLTFESDREPTPLYEPAQVADFLTAPGERLVIVSQRTLATWRKDPRLAQALKGMRVLEQREAIAHYLTPGYLLERKGRLADTTVLLLSTK